MNKEIEIKLKYKDEKELRNKLVILGANPTQTYEIIEPAKLKFVEIEGKNKQDVETVRELFKELLESIDKNFFDKLD